MVAYSFKPRFVLPIRAGLGLIGITDDRGREIPAEFVFNDGETISRPFNPEVDLDPPITPKRQTIRALRGGRSRHASPGEIVQLYCGMRTKQCFKIGEARCKSVERIKIVIVANTIETIAIDDVRLVGTFLQDFAKSDGFANADEMRIFWLKNHYSDGNRLEFNGVLIKWEPLP